LLRARLRDAEDLAWAFPELCADGIVPPARFSTNAEFTQFRSRFAEALIESSGPRRFCLCWIISENKAWCTGNELVRARREMKALHPQLHSRYMQRLA
jgi:hypothetical protein